MFSRDVDIGDTYYKLIQALGDFFMNVTGILASVISRDW